MSKFGNFLFDQHPKMQNATILLELVVGELSRLGDVIFANNYFELVSRRLHT